MTRNGYVCHSHLVNDLKNNVIVNEDKRKSDNIIYDYSIFDQLEEIPEIITKIKETDFYIEPNLPIDIICSETRGEKDEENDHESKFTYYFIYLVVSTKVIPDKLTDRILFYKYYLSRIISSKRLEIVLVTLTKTDKLDKEFLKNNGIGLLKYVKKNKSFRSICKSRSQRDQMTIDFIKEEPQNIPLFFDRYIHDAVSAIAGVTPDEFGKRYIDKQVLSNVLDLENISYRKPLTELINEHLSEKGNEYEFTSEVFSFLWQSNVGISYKDFLEKFDPVLMQVFSEKAGKSGRIYRDHYIHQFQVFLMGLCIIDKLYNKFIIKYKKPEIIWLIIASFHDIAYPVQLYDKWSDDFFRNAFNVPKSLSHIDLKTCFVDESFMCCTHSLVARLCKIFCNENLTGDWLTAKKELVKFFFKKITEAKNHSILSSISLLKMIQAEYQENISIDNMTFSEVYEEIVKPSALSIAIHDSEIYNELRNNEIWIKLKEKTPIPFLKFDDDPLSFLLIFCDNIQEWGRPSKTFVKTNENRWKHFYLKDFVFKNFNSIDVTIWTPNNTKCHDLFQKKQTELREIQQFLQQPSDFNFVIRLRDKNDEGEDFPMHGSSS